MMNSLLAKNTNEKDEEEFVDTMERPHGPPSLYEKGDPDPEEGHD